jgi:hypothetical protein
LAYQRTDGAAAELPDNKIFLIDATYLKAHRTVSSLGLKGGWRLIGQKKNRMNTKLYAVTDKSGPRSTSLSPPVRLAIALERTFAELPK